ncbi:hypothetical protein [Acaryochloris marina]|uniref:Uncharacterized protein n=1 Tax=Acaryochloris marina (strain MBIC 11017) TaxID=329726 RepID=B0C1Z0_ACAM1|nr:hypothetical protein [Acaryochloris marina]ABW27291.1 hypothetical protein AM1_2280 [Acaryochloris marina MBIC11017]BDM82038.1 hypothetical protein AM10699_49020 [Acaryochloris marina MBIC10699]
MPKKKGTPGGNPNPVQTPQFIAKQFKADDVPEGVKLQKGLTAVRLPEDIADLVNGLGKEKPAWLRRVITTAVKQELMGGEE